MSDQTYLQVFVEEGREHVQRMNTLLLQLENEPDNTEWIQELFRSAHTLKGMSATMGYENMAELTHELENVLQQMRDGQFKLTGETMDMLFRGVDRLENMVEQAASGDEMEDAHDLLSTLRGVETAAGAGTTGTRDDRDVSFDEFERSVIQTSLNKGNYVYLITVTIDAGCLLKGARAYMVYDALERNGDVIKSVPAIEDLEEGKFDRSFQFVVITTEDSKTIRQTLDQISELEHVHVSHLAESANHEVSERFAPSDRASQKTRSTTSVGPSKVSKTIRVDIDRLDTLMNLFSEWVIDRGQLEQIAATLEHPGLTEIVEHMNRIGGEMQDTILHMRMVPVEQVFNRFPRMMRDLAKDLQKKVQFDMTGQETELDRTVIDEIGDPLVHLLRNALDHGVEKPEERRRKGKPETGRIQLKAFHSGNHVFIEIEDDGAGINRDAVLQNAISKEVVDKETADKLTDAEVYDLLFASGFSTAEQVTDISGRGVGLDVVRSKIESLGGSVTVHSADGRGTTFSIQLPLTLSILTALLVRVGEEKYAVPLTSILETGKFGKHEVHKVHGQPVLRFRERVVPLLSLQKVFAVPPENSRQQGDLFVVIVKKGEKLTGLIVDEFIGQQEVVLKSLGNYLNNVFAISGATILGDGQVALIVDANALVQQNETPVAAV